MGTTCCNNRNVKDNTLNTGRPPTYTKPNNDYTTSEHNNINANNLSLSYKNSKVILINNNEKDVTNDKRLNDKKNDTLEKDKLEIESFTNELLEEINFVRTNPQLYANKIEQFIDYIKPNAESKTCSYLFSYEDYPKINLIRGAVAFKEAITILKQTQPLPPLQLSSEIAIKVPDKIDLYNNKDIIIESIKNLKADMNKLNKYRVISFHYDNGSINAEISTLLQIVDDNNANCQRRANILNPAFNYLGVSVGKIKSKRYFIYLTFASE